MINRYVGRPRYDRGPTVFQTVAMTTSANGPYKLIIGTAIKVFDISFLSDSNRGINSGKIALKPLN